MLNQTRYTRRSLIVVLLLSSVLFLATFFRVGAVAPTVIDFEGVNMSGAAGGTVDAETFKNLGVLFTPVQAFDVNQMVGPGFAHSGRVGLVLCLGVENCRSPLEVKFTARQQRIKVWVGYSGLLLSAEPVIMRGFDNFGNQVASGHVTIGPASNPIPINTALEMTANAEMITRITVGFVNAEFGPMFNNGLSIDDLEFDNVGSPPVCPVPQAPVFTLNKPTSGQVVIHNTFSVEGSLPVANPGATLRIDVTGEGGQTKVFNPAPVSPGSFSFPNIGDLLFPGLNKLVFTVRDCGGSFSIERTIHFRSDITHTPLLVIDENNIPARGAEIYADGNLLGRTDQNGIFKAVPALREGTRVIARKFITESTAYRKHHSLGSFQDWKYRAYISNLAVNNDGTVSAYSVQVPQNPLAFQVVRVLRRNALIGLHLVVSLNWDASEEELTLIKERLVETSRILYNATEGQMLIEQADIVDDFGYFEDTDIRVLANQSHTARSSGSGFFYDGFFPGTATFRTHWIRMSRVEGSDVLLHELGHYLFGVKDEYEESEGGDRTQCTAQVNPRAAARPDDSCVMFLSKYPKFCSHRPENPHVTSTEQGDESCWQEIVESFTDSDGRWKFQSPETRGTILGQINSGFLPLASWITRVTIENRSHPNLCRPILFTSVKPDGTLSPESSVQLYTTYKKAIFQGLTDKTTAQILVTGAHVGDVVNHYTIQSSDCAVTARTIDGPSPDTVRFQPAAFMATTQAPIQRSLIVEPPAFNILTELNPGKRDQAEISVRVRNTSGQSVMLAERPVVNVRAPGADEIRAVPVRYEALRDVYVGTLRKLPVGGEIEIEVSATARSGQMEGTVGRFAIGEIDPKDRTEIYSTDGQLALKIAAGMLPAGSRISIGPATVLPPVFLPSGYTVVSGPYSVWLSAENCLPRFGILNFQVPRQGDNSGMTGYIRESFTVLRYDPGMQRWDRTGETIHPNPVDVVSFRTSQLGNFVLVARREPAKTRPRGFR